MYLRLPQAILLLVAVIRGVTSFESRLAGSPSGPSFIIIDRDTGQWDLMSTLIDWGRCYQGCCRVMPLIDCSSLTAHELPAASPSMLHYIIRRIGLPASEIHLLHSGTADSPPEYPLETLCTLLTHLRVLARVAESTSPVVILDGDEISLRRDQVEHFLPQLLQAMPASEWDVLQLSPDVSNGFGRVMGRFERFRWSGELYSIRDLCGRDRGVSSVAAYAVTPSAARAMLSRVGWGDSVLDMRALGPDPTLQKLLFETPGADRTFVANYPLFRDLRQLMLRSPVTQWPLLLHVFADRPFNYEDYKDLPLFYMPEDHPLQHMPQITFPYEPWEASHNQSALSASCSKPRPSAGGPDMHHMVLLDGGMMVDLGTGLQGARQLEQASVALCAQRSVIADFELCPEVFARAGREAVARCLPSLDEEVKGAPEGSQPVVIWMWLSGRFIALPMGMKGKMHVEELRSLIWEHGAVGREREAAQIGYNAVRSFMKGADAQQLPHSAGALRLVATEEAIGRTRARSFRAMVQELSQPQEVLMAGAECSIDGREKALGPVTFGASPVGLESPLGGSARQAEGMAMAREIHVWHQGALDDQASNSTRLSSSVSSCSTQDSHSGNDSSSITGFWHVAMLGGAMWRDIVADQDHAMRASGLLANTSAVHVSLLGPPQPKGYEQRGRLPWEQGSANAERYKLWQHPDVGLYEFPTLARLFYHCQRSEPGALVWYAHNKGASHVFREGYRFLHGQGWRRMMDRYVLGPGHAGCVRHLRAGVADMCGVALNTSDNGTHNGENLHYVGNMWWARCDYINRLRPPTDWQLVNRINAELWIAMHPQGGRLMECIGHPRIPGDLYSVHVTPSHYLGAESCEFSDWARVFTTPGYDGVS